MKFVSALVLGTFINKNPFPIVFYSNHQANYTQNMTVIPTLLTHLLQFQSQQQQMRNCNTIITNQTVPRYRNTNYHPDQTHHRHHHQLTRVMSRCQVSCGVWHAYLSIDNTPRTPVTQLRRHLTTTSIITSTIQLMLDYHFIGTISI